LPLQPTTADPYSYNLGNYKILASPKSSLYYRESPPPALYGRETIRFSKKKLLVCPAGSSRQFTIDSGEIGVGAVLSGDQIMNNKIQYTPISFDDPEIYFEDDLQSVKFYNQKIISSKFKFKN